ncbi:MAG: MFS transporter [Nitriliruptoraceae bacterium]
MRRLLATFVSLRNRNLRLFFTGQAISATGTWIQKIAQAWLVLELTDSGTLLGVTAALQQLPILLVGPWGGLLADRLDKRKLLVATQSISALLAVVLGGLTQTGNITWWMVLILALLLGMTDALDRPARQTFVAELVPREQLTNAVLMNSVIMNSAFMTGPAIAGVLITTVGLAASFYINAASFLAVIIALLLLDDAERLRSPSLQKRRGQLVEGFRYVRTTPELIAPLILMGVVGLFLFNWAVMIPLLARDVFGGDADLFGSMFALMGVGAVIGGLAVAGTLKASMSALIRSAWVLGVLVIMLAAAPTLWSVFFVLVCLGAANILVKATTNAYLQLTSEPDKRGRVLSLLTVAFAGTTPLGAPLVGWIADVFGVRFALGLGGSIAIFAAAITAIYLRRSGSVVPVGACEGD